ncbi:MFS transporter [Mycolicibacterium tusciae]|uniref:MFS transporter n=1 Tax=Mycolicibacterium tusciae TaxID=75922 RepID=A0A1X0JTI5_9MYCO|nr:MFS transporter [Mycolicibacterium tusciae]
MALTGKQTADVRLRLSPAQWWTLVVSCLSVALVVGAMAALYASLPEIAAATGASQQQLTWIIDGYTLALACLVLPAGAVGDRYGRRAVLVIGLAVFSAGSAVPIVVDDPLWIIAARAVAGVGAAFVMPSTLSLLTAGFPDSQRGRAVGVWAGVAGSGAVLGILCSGLLLNYWSWVSSFAGMTAAGVVLLALALTIAESQDQSHTALDPWGSAWVAIAIGLAVVALIEGPARGWTDPVVVGGFLGSAVAAVLFVVVELRVDHPLLDVRLFGDRGFGSGTVSVALQFLVTFGVFMLLVQYLQLILGYAPLPSAIALVPMGVPLVIISLFAPWLSDRVGLRVVTAAGLVVIGVGLIISSRLDVNSDYWPLLYALLVMSTGLGLCTAPATAAIVKGTPVEKHGVAAAVNDAAREVGAAVGIAIAGSILAAGYADRVTPALTGLPEPLRGPFSESLAAAAEAADRAGPQGAQLVEVAQSAFVHGSQQASIVLACITFAAAATLAVWAPGRTQPRATTPEDEAQTVPSGSRNLR